MAESVKPEGAWPNVLTPVKHFGDKWDSLPLRVGEYAHSIGEAIKPVAAHLTKPLTFTTMGFMAFTSFQRSRAAGENERHPELFRKAKVSAAMDSVLTAWLEAVTLPSIAVGTITSASAAAFKTAAPAVARWGPAGLALATLPVVIPACSHAADTLMDWAFRPVIRYLSKPSDTLLRGPTDYVPPPLEEVLASLEASLEGGNTAGKGAEYSLLGLVPPDLDPLERARLEWALDGDAESPYPEDQDAAGLLGSPNGAGSGSSGASGSGSAGAPPSALAAALGGRPAPGKSAGSSSIDGGKSGSSSSSQPLSPEAAYLEAVAEIRNRAKARVVAQQQQGQQQGQPGQHEAVASSAAAADAAGSELR